MKHKFSNFHLIFKMHICMKMKWNQIFNASIFDALAIIMSNFHWNITFPLCSTPRQIAQGSRLKSQIVTQFLVLPPLNPTSIQTTSLNARNEALSHDHSNSIIHFLCSARSMSMNILTSFHFLTYRQKWSHKCLIKEMSYHFTSLS